MKKLRFGILLLALAAIFGTAAMAKTHKTDIIPTDIIQFSLEEEDKLTCELYIDEDGIYSIRVADIFTESNFTPKISLTLSQGKNQIFYYETNMPLLEDDTFNSEKFNFAACLTQGEYQLSIENLTKFSDIIFRIETSFTEQKNIETFDNNSFEKATGIETGTRYFGAASMEKEKDFYRFEVSDDGYAYIQMYSPEAKCFALYDAEKNEIGSIGIEIEEADKVYELCTGLAKGTYFISVEPYDDYTLPLYSLKVEYTVNDGFEKEYNNTKATATSVKSGEEYKGNLFGTEDEDIYTFTLAEKSTVTLDFTDTIASRDGHYSVNLSDGKNTIFSSKECGRVSETLILDKGSYYFTVFSLGEKRFTSMGYKVKFNSDKEFTFVIPEEKPDEKEEDKQTIQFADVGKDKWYYGELLEAKSLGLIEGLGDNKYNPTGDVTVAEAITMAARIKNKLGGENTELLPSSVGKWYNSYITFAVNAGLINSDDFDNFERSATRAEIAYIFANIFGEIETEKNTLIPDVDESVKYCDSIHRLYALGILKGDDEKGTFYPERNLSRAEAAVILLRVHNLK